MKRVLLWAPYRGAVGTRAAFINTANILAKRYEVVVLALVDEWDTALQEFDPSVTVRKVFRSKLLSLVGTSNSLHRRDFYLLSVVAIPKLFFLLRRIKPDHVMPMLLVVPMILAQLGCTSKLVVSVQGSPGFLQVNSSDRGVYFGLENKLRGKLWRLFYSQARMVLCMSESTSRRLREFMKGTDVNIATVRNPLFSEPVGTRTKLKAPFDRFIFVGRDSFQKNFDLAIRFFNRVQAANKKLIVYGDFERDIDDDAIDFKGYVSNFWGRELGKGAVHLVTSRWEDPGHAILEGLIRGVPTIIIGNHSDFHSIYRAYDVPIFEDVDTALQFLEAPTSQSLFERQIAARNSVYAHYSFDEYEKKVGEILCSA